MPAWTRKLSLIALFAFALILLPSAASAQTEIVLGDGNTGGPVLTVDRSDSSSVELALYVSTLTAAPLETKGGAFSLLSLEDYGYAGEVGKPALPAVREFIEVPHGASCELLLYDAVYAEYALSDLGIAGRIAPNQAPVVKIEGAREAAPFVIDRAVYGTDAYVLEETARSSEAAQKASRRFRNDNSPADSRGPRVRLKKARTPPANVPALKTTLQKARPTMPPTAMPRVRYPGRLLS